jgi:hypothetical protein
MREEPRGCRDVRVDKGKSGQVAHQGGHAGLGFSLMPTCDIEFAFDLFPHQRFFCKQYCT